MVQEGIPCTLVTDNMAGHLMSRGDVDLVIVGADRIAANGDTANKIGTYTLAVLARAPRPAVLRRGAALHHRLAASPTARAIPIEERPADEVTGYRGMRWAPEGVSGAQSGVRRHAGGADHRRSSARRAWCRRPRASGFSP